MRSGRLFCSHVCNRQIDPLKPPAFSARSTIIHSTGSLRLFASFACSGNLFQNFSPLRSTTTCRISNFSFGIFHFEFQISTSPHFTLAFGLGIFFDAQEFEFFILPSFTSEFFILNFDGPRLRFHALLPQILASPPRELQRLASV